MSALPSKSLLASSVLCLALLGAGLMPGAAQTAVQKSLYERLGRYDAIAAVTDEFLSRLLGDKAFERFFVGHSADSKQRIRQLVVEQLCAGAGPASVWAAR